MFDNWPDPQLQGQINALSDELWFHKEQRSTFLAYWLFCFVASALGPVFRPPTEFWGWLSLIFCVVMAVVSFVLWLSAWGHVRRLRKLIRRIDPTYPL